MNRNPIKYQNRAGLLSWRVWIAIAVTPLFIGCLAAIGFGIYEWQASSKLAARYESYKQAGEPYDNASLDAWYRARTHTEATQDWLDIISAMQVDKVLDDLPVFGIEKSLPAELRAGSDWGDAQSVGSFINASEPLRAKILQALELPKPVYLPIEFNGSQTLLPHLQESRQIQRFLLLDFEYAYYQGNTKRAMEDLVAMQKFVKVMDAPATLVMELVTIALNGVHLVCVQRSLTNSQWNEAELQQLLSDLQPVYYQPERWRDCIQGERAFGASLTAADFDSSGSGRVAINLFPLMPSGKLKILDAMDEMTGLYQVPLSSLRSSAVKLQTRIQEQMAGPSFDGAALYMGLILPSMDAIASAFARAEETRLWTRAAVALRLYHLQKKEWPASLMDLKEVGLGPADLQLVEGGRFGYEVEDGVAYLWSTDYRDFKLSPERPTSKSSSNPDEQPYNLIILR